MDVEPEGWEEVFKRKATPKSGRKQSILSSEFCSTNSFNLLADLSGPTLALKNSHQAQQRMLTSDLDMAELPSFSNSKPEAMIEQWRVSPSTSLPAISSPVQSLTSVLVSTSSVPKPLHSFQSSSLQFEGDLPSSSSDRDQTSLFMEEDVFSASKGGPAPNSLVVSLPAATDATQSGNPPTTSNSKVHTLQDSFKSLENLALTLLCSTEPSTGQTEPMHRCQNSANPRLHRDSWYFKGVSARFHCRPTRQELPEVSSAGIIPLQ
eukprot:Gb_11086 [translate_table: standard]